MSSACARSANAFDMPPTAHAFSVLARRRSRGVQARWIRASRNFLHASPLTGQLVHRFTVEHCIARRRDEEP